MTGGDGHGAAGNGQSLGEKPHQLLVRRSVNRRRRQPDLQGVAVAACHVGGASARNDMHDERGRQNPSPRISSHLSAMRTTIATMGLRSNIPTGGTTRRIGSTSQSVRV